MHGIVKVLARPVTKTASTQCEHIKPVRLKLVPSVSEAKEVQTTFADASPQTSQLSDSLEKLPKPVLPSPQPQILRLHSARYRRHLNLLRQHKHTPEQDDLRVLHPTPNTSTTDKNQPLLASKSAEKSHTNCLRLLEGKPVPGKAIRMLPKSSISFVNISGRESQSESRFNFSQYSLGQASVPPQYSLPSVYSQSFGVSITETGKRNEIMHVVGELLLLPVAAMTSYKVTQIRMDYYVMTIGTLVPVSRCCRSALLIHLQKEGDCVVTCTAWECPTPCLTTVQLTTNYRQRLWKSSQLSARPSKTVKSHRSRSTCISQVPRLPTKSSLSRSPQPHPPTSKSPCSNPFDLKDSVTFHPPDHSLVSNSPVRRIFAKSRSKVRMLSLDELRSLWLSAVS